MGNIFQEYPNNWGCPYFLKKIMLVLQWYMGWDQSLCKSKPSRKTNHIFSYLYSKYCPISLWLIFYAQRKLHSGLKI